MMIISELIFEGVEVVDKSNNAFNNGLHVVQSH